MKSIKIILSAILSVCIIIPGISHASADRLNVNYSFNNDSNTLSISGEILSKRGAIPLVMKLTRLSDNAVIATDSMVTTDNAADGVVSYSFRDISFSNNTASGEYRIYVSADFIREEKVIPFSYQGIDKRIYLINNINTAIDEQKDGDILDSIYLDDGSGNADNVLSIDKEIFNSLGEKARSNLASRLIGLGKYTLPVEVSDDGSFPELTDDDIDVIQNSISVLTTNYNTSLRIALASDISSKEDFDSYISKWGGADFYEDDEATPYNEKEIKDYVKKAKEYSSYFAYINNSAETAEDFAELKDAIYKGALLELIENGRYTDIKEITDKFSQIFTLNISDLSKLSSSIQTEVYQDMASFDSFESVEDFISKFNSTVSQKSSAQNIGGSGGNKGNSGSSGVSSTGGHNVSTGLINQSQVSPFDDLGNHEWARNAIEELYKLRIVAGKGNRSFDPSASVTRAEFVKMVYEAFDVEAAVYNGEFTDVNASDWYAPYVAGASKSGIINGSEGLFNPNGLITRQDMAVILCRAMGNIPSEQTRDVFADSYNISNYAKDAVFAMYRKGIIKGVGNEMFAPLNNASRAEAAQMIYNAIK